MHIKSIHLDGFKSYQKHTDIGDFSPTFNAITGYNGSGKSNILDSICFILGINKLDNIRAKSMHELISHGGTKATVQIRFDNTDKSCSPFGMEHLNEVVVQRTITAQATGKGCATNYTLNGHAATNGKIQDFFRGIGLNVNNPHFLIMQGRITTVLNMKPEEILGMVEEAAGTKMYDQKKKDAEKAMFLKEAKLQEIDRIFTASIDPRMEKFREDRKNMVEVTRLHKLKENSQRKYEAYEYYQTCDSVHKDIQAIEDTKKSIEDLDKKIEQLNLDVENKEQEKIQLEKTRDNADEESELGRIYTEKQSFMLKKENERNLISDAINKLNKDGERISKGITKDRQVLEAKRKDLEESKNVNQKDIQGHKDDEALVEKYRNDLESLTRGTIANDKGEHVSIESEIQECRTKAASMEAAMRTAKSRADRLNARIPKLNREKDVLVSKSSSELGVVTSIEKQIGELNHQIGLLGFDADRDNQMRERATFLKEKIRDLDNENKALIASYKGGRYSLTYTSPPVPKEQFTEKNDLLGYIAHYVRMKPGCEQYAVAADIALSSVMGNLIVSTQNVARLLIDSKAFTGRKTMVPISENNRNNGRNHVISDAAVQIARNVAAKYGEDVIKIIDMIEYPEYISNTILGAVGQILVVKTLNCAREVSYTEGVKTRVISIRGDDVKPSGVMTGGYSESTNQPCLLLYAPLQPTREKIEVLEKELDTLNLQIEATEASSQKYRELNNQLIAATRKLSQLKSSMKNSELGMVEKELDEARQSLEENKAELESTSKALNEMNEKINSLETMKNNDKHSLEKRKKDLTTLLQKAEKVAAQNKDKGEKAKRAVMMLQAAVDQIEQTIKNDEVEWERKKKECDELEEKLPAAEEALMEAQLEEQAAKTKMTELKNNQRQVTTRLARVAKECDALRKEDTKAKSKKEEKEKELVRLQESEKQNRKHAQVMVRKHEWLADEEQHFNKKGGLYDFDGYSFNKGANEIKDLTDKIDKLERCLCMKNVSNLDTCEAKVIDIKNKREKLNEDFKMLKKTISVLDKKKVDELIRAHESVDKDFGKIFNCLLPDATATLVPPLGKTVTEGLEVKVSFNGVQKDSLHELSGGQRSLVALSLILAMLKFKPAPLYILDEVDAALDLSHTANIGMMIATHFKYNQFIIVSLKQGMFSNADVLFQTSFADGHSTCHRLTGTALLNAINDELLAQQALELMDNGKGKKGAKKGQTKKGVKGAGEA